MQPDHHIAPTRILTLGAMTFFYVSNEPTEFGNLDRDLDILLDSLYAAKKLGGLGERGPDLVRYFPEPAQAGLYRMEVGIAVEAETAAAGAARVKALPEFPCAGVLLWGSLAHIGQAYAALKLGMETAGVKHSGECREWNYYFESVDSPNNAMGIYMGTGG